MNNSGLEYVIRLALQKAGVVEGVEAVRSAMAKLGEASQKVSEVAAETRKKIDEGMDAVAKAADAEFDEVRFAFGLSKNFALLGCFT